MFDRLHRLIIRIFIIALLVNASASLYYPYISAFEKDTHYKELSKILGETVYICSGNYVKGGYLSSFERLDQEQHQKLKKQIDVTSSSNASPNYKYINDVYSAYIASTHNGSIRPFEKIIRPEFYQLSLKFSTAPPHIS